MKYKIALGLFALLLILPALTLADTGGNITFAGGFTIHTFLGNGTYVVTDSKEVEVLIVAGGGGAGGGRAGHGGTGAGGAGGYRTAFFNITAMNFTITVGEGGLGGIGGGSNADGAKGQNSSFGTLLNTTGGGTGARASGSGAQIPGGPGGSGGGGYFSPGGTGGAGNEGNYTPSEGNRGGDGNIDSPLFSGGGGGGSATGGINASAGVAGDGGNGTTNNISGSDVIYAGGGGSGSVEAPFGIGGTGGGADGTNNTGGFNATLNTGGGGGGTSRGDVPGGNGGSGIVIISYLTVGPPFIEVRLQDIYDNANLEGLTVTLLDGTSNSTQSDGIAHFENKSSQSFNVTDPDSLYFDFNSTSDPVQNTTTTYEIFGAQITFVGLNSSNGSISIFSVNSSAQSNSTTNGSLQLFLAPNVSNAVDVTAINFRPVLLEVNTTGQDLSIVNFNLQHDTNLSVEAVNINNISERIPGFCVLVDNENFSTSKCSTVNETIFFDAEFSTGDYNVTTFSVGVGDGTSGSFSSNTTEFFINGTVNASLASTPLSLVLTFLDEETRDSMNGTNVSVSLIDSLGNITDFVTDTGFLNITGNLTEGDFTVRYTATNFSLRDFFFTLSLDDPVTTETLYLLRAAIFSPGTVQVRNFDGTNVVGAQVTMSRYYGNDTIPNLVQAGTTDNDGNVVFVAESVTAFYTFDVIVDGVFRVQETTPQLLTVDTSGLWSKTIVLNRTGLDEVNQNTGFLFIFSPQGALQNNTLQGFNATINSSNWDILSCEFSLFNAVSGTLLNTTDGFCSASTGIGQLFFSITTTDALFTQLSINTSLFNNTYTQYYTVISELNNSFTLSDLADDLTNFSGAGFNNFSRFFISIIVMIGITFGLSTRTNFINNPEEMMLLIFMMSLGFSYIDWLNLGIQNVPTQAINQWGVSLLLGFIAFMSGFRKFGVTD